VLTHLALKNFAIVDELALDLSHGMTALTGETGAGKSIIIDALDLALGGRGSTSIIRHGANRADISAIFNVANIPGARTWLTEQQFDNDDNDVLLRRSISDDGRSRHTINGQPCTQAQMRELGELLLNIHGQHEHQNLLKRDKQREIVDRYGKHHTLLADLQKTYYAWYETEKQYQQLANAPDEQQAKIELLQYHVKELQTLALADDELNTLEEEHKQLAHADQLRDNVQQAINALDGDDTTSINQLLNVALQQLQKAAQFTPKVQNSIEMLSSARIQIQEANNELQDYLEQLQIDPERLFTVEQRLQLIHALARKHHTEPENLIALQQRLEQQLEQLLHADEHKQQLQQQLSKLRVEYQQRADKLSTTRAKATKKIASLVTESMQTLGMQQGQFAIKIEQQAEPSPYGQDKIEFQVSANPGQPLQALSKVASGGEMSRISLALQMITAQKDDTPTLIFDEVDVGIGGGTAEIVGKLLRQLGEKAQVLCITHLPQVAAQAQQHLLVQKLTKQQQTSTKIIALATEPRIEEIARMLGGVKITEQTRKHAEEMLLSNNG
jgi:DNA repair protein RecN (Recombination protein N)